MAVSVLLFLSSDGGEHRSTGEERRREEGEEGRRETTIPMGCFWGGGGYGIPVVCVMLWATEGPRRERGERGEGEGEEGEGSEGGEGWKGIELVERGKRIRTELVLATVTFAN